jgi:hypothetical protein
MVKYDVRPDAESIEYKSLELARPDDKDVPPPSVAPFIIHPRSDEFIRRFKKEYKAIFPHECMLRYREAFEIACAEEKKTNDPELVFQGMKFATVLIPLTKFGGGVRCMSIDASCGGLGNPGTIFVFKLLNRFDNLTSLHLVAPYIDLGPELHGLKNLKVLEIEGSGAPEMTWTKSVVTMKVTLPPCITSLTLYRTSYIGDDDFALKIKHVQHLVLKRSCATTLSKMEITDLKSVVFDCVAVHFSRSIYDLPASITRVAFYNMSIIRYENDASCMARLTNLSDIIFDGCMDVEIPALQGITKLIVYESTLLDPRVDLTHMSNLRYLRLSLTPFEDLRGLPRSLERLSLTQSSATVRLEKDLWPDISHLTALTYLSVCNCNQDIDMSAFRNFKHLKYLNIHGNMLHSPISLKNVEMII